jgi:hypothetical protein
LRAAGRLHAQDVAEIRQLLEIYLDPNVDTSPIFTRGALYSRPP